MRRPGKSVFFGNTPAAAYARSRSPWRARAARWAGVRCDTSRASSSRSTVAKWRWSRSISDSGVVARDGASRAARTTTGTNNLSMTASSGKTDGPVRTDHPSKTHVQEDAGAPLWRQPGSHAHGGRGLRIGGGVQEGAQPVGGRYHADPDVRQREGRRRRAVAHHFGPHNDPEQAAEYAQPPDPGRPFTRGVRHEAAATQRECGNGLGKVVPRLPAHHDVVGHGHGSFLEP